MEQEGKQVCLVAFIRHGERADHAPTKVKYDTPHDPPLTKKGIQQAAETGMWLLDYLTQEDYEEVIIESSPFIRSMMTAAQIAKAIGHSQIRVNYRYSEWLDRSFYSHNPIKTLEIKTKAHNKIVEDYLDGVEFQDTTDYYKQINTAFPEERHRCINRTKSCVSYFSYKYCKAKKKIAHLIVSHGIHVTRFAKLQGGYAYTSKYCSISGVEVDRRGSELIFDACDDHVISK